MTARSGAGVDGSLSNAAGASPARAAASSAPLGAIDGAHFVGLHVIPRGGGDGGVSSSGGRTSGWGVVTSDCMSRTALRDHRSQWCARPSGSQVEVDDLLEGALYLSKTLPPGWVGTHPCLAAVGYSMVSIDTDARVFEVLGKKLPWCVTASSIPIPSLVDRLQENYIMVAVDEDADAKEFPTVVVNMAVLRKDVRDRPTPHTSMRSIEEVLRLAARSADLTNSSAAAAGTGRGPAEAEVWGSYINEVVQANLAVEAVRNTTGTKRGKNMAAAALNNVVTQAERGPSGLPSPRVTYPLANAGAGAVSSAPSSMAHASPVPSTSGQAGILHK